MLKIIKRLNSYQKQELQDELVYLARVQSGATGLTDGDELRQAARREIEIRKRLVRG